MFVAVASEANLNVILGVAWKRVLDQHPATRAKWEPLDVLLLCQVWRGPVSIAARSTARRPDGKTADFFPGGDVSVEQRGGKIGWAHIVEAVTGVVFWQ